MYRVTLTTPACSCVLYLSASRLWLEACYFGCACSLTVEPV
jgi:hypothetical protein